uniref:FBA_2 domain-containing protein n=2 Tax=Caenorhabditis tropicalis TaxID=1561998 RepID=A0A1I7UTM2_9PELO
MLVNYLLDTFTMLTISVEFFDPIKPASALELIKMFYQRKVSIKSLRYQISRDSSEFISKILDECTKVTDYVSINAVHPNLLVYTPPRPFKTKMFRVWGTTNWFNLESFISCRCIFLNPGDNSNRTAETYSLFFNKWMDSDVRLQKLTLYFLEQPEYQMIMNALSNQGTKRIIDKDWIEVTRRNGSEFLIEAVPKIVVIYSKQGYLDCWNMI